MKSFMTYIITSGTIMSVKSRKMWDGLGMWQEQEIIKITIIFWRGRLKEREYLRNLGVEGKVKLKFILKDLVEMMCGVDSSG